MCLVALLFSFHDAGGHFCEKFGHELDRVLFGFLAHCSASLDKADELLAEAEKLAASTTMTQTEAVYAIIQKMTDEANAQLSL